MKDFLCIICPNGCKITIDDNGNISGNKCPRGVAYVKQESTNPTRTVTTTMKVVNGKARIVPCKTSVAVPKAKIFDVMAEINNTEVVAPVKMHQVLIRNVADTGVDVIATKEVC